MGDGGERGVKGRSVDGLWSGGVSAGVGVYGAGGVIPVVEVELYRSALAKPIYMRCVRGVDQ